MWTPDARPHAHAQAASQTRRTRTQVDQTVVDNGSVKVRSHVHTVVPARGCNKTTLGLASSESTHSRLMLASTAASAHQHAAQLQSQGSTKQRISVKSTSATAAEDDDEPATAALLKRDESNSDTTAVPHVSLFDF
jgi:hypothetical protein